MIRIIGVLVTVIVALSVFLYFQIQKAGEYKNALKTFQAAYSEQVEENQKINRVLLKREKANLSHKKTLDELKRLRHEKSKALGPDDCINTHIPDDIRLLIDSKSRTDKPP
jgi:hypothetical protein